MTGGKTGEQAEKETGCKNRGVEEEGTRCNLQNRESIPDNVQLIDFKETLVLQDEPSASSVASMRDEKGGVMNRVTCLAKATLLYLCCGAYIFQACPRLAIQGCNSNGERLTFAG